MSAELELFAPLLGVWRTTGAVLDERGAVTAEIIGSDTYESMPGGGWVVHRVAVRIGGEPVHALELIGEHDAAAGSWAMHAFDADGSRAVMRATRDGDGWLFAGDGVRAHLHPAPDGTTMAATWERSSPAGWLRWMDLSFLRQPSG